MSSNRGIVATGHPLVSEAALQMLKIGGNAFDAAVAAGFAGAIAEPALTSLGGGGFLLAKPKDGEATLFDFFVDTPGKGRPLDNLEPNFFPVTIQFPGSTQEFNVGLGSVAVPGNLKGFLHVHKKLGSLSLKEIVKPAIQMAREGVVLNSHQAYFLNMLRPIMVVTEASKQIFEPNGKYVQEGDLLKNPELASFLERIAEENSADIFYKGEIADRIAADMDAGNGLLTKKDLAEYEVKEREPLKVQYKNYLLLTNPPPSFGGVLIRLALEILDRLPLDNLKWGSPEHLLAVALAQREVDSLRSDDCHSLLELERIKKAEQAANYIKRRLWSKGTTHVSIADGYGNVASMTTSNGEGSGYIVPGTGIMLNNMMGEDDLHPEGFHSSEPGHRVSSMMSPSLLLDKNKVRLVLGSGGSKRIRTAIVQVLLNYVDFGLDIEKSVKSPRLHWDGKKLQVEPGYERSSLIPLEKEFEVNLWDRLDVYFGGVHAVEPQGSGCGDPRRGGCVMKLGE